VRPWREGRNRRGAPRRIPTQGHACRRPGCPYHGITDATIHALVADGRHGRSDRIQDFRCQACGSKVTALYQLKTPPTRIGEVHKRYRRRRLVRIRYQMTCGTRRALRVALLLQGWSGKIQTAFVERVNLTARQSVAALTRRQLAAAGRLVARLLPFRPPAPGLAAAPPCPHAGDGGGPDHPSLERA
jgi:hypothetical protein